MGSTIKCGSELGLVLIRRVGLPEQKKTRHPQCFHISLLRMMKLSLHFRVTSKHPSFGWNLVYFGITLTFLIQTSGSSLLADYYRGQFVDIIVIIF